MLIVGHESAIHQFRTTTIKHLVAKGVTTHVLVTGRKLDGLDFLKKLGVSFSYLNLSHLSKNPFVVLSYVFKMAHQIHDFEPTAILVRNAQGLAFLRWSRLLSFKRPKIVALVEGLGQADTKLITVLWRLAFRAYKDVVLLNQDDFDDLHARKVLSAKNTVQVCKGIGVELDRFVPTAFPETEEFRVVMISRLIPQKGIFDYLSAAKLLSDQSKLNVKFILIGSYPENADAKLKEMISAYDKAGYISLIGIQTDVRPYLENTHLHILPSWYREGWPATVMEAAAMGRASIVTTAPAVRCCVTQDTGWKVPAKDPQALATCIEQALTSKDYISKGEAAADYAAKHYDRTKFDALIVKALIVRAVGS